MASASPSRNDNYDYDNMAIANATIPFLRVHADGSLSMCPDEADEDAQKSQKTEASQQAGGKRAAQGTLPEVLEPKPKAKFMASTKAFDFKKALGVTGPGSGGSRGLRQRRGCRSVSDCEHRHESQEQPAHWHTSPGLGTSSSSSSSASEPHPNPHHGHHIATEEEAFQLLFDGMMRGVPVEFHFVD